MNYYPHISGASPVARRIAASALAAVTLLVSPAVASANKVQVTELMFDCVYKCMQIVGVNSLELQYGFGKILREAAVLPIYDGGNMGMQRRRIHDVLADPLFNPNAIFEDEYVEFGKQHESIDTLDGTTERETAPALA